MENDQIENFYLSIGKFTVSFEHLFLGVKQKITFLAGFNEETKIILEAHSFRQAIDTLKKLIDWRTQDWNEDNKELKLFQKLVKDLNKINVERNSVIHTTWFVGSDSNQKANLELLGYKYSGGLNRRFKKLSINQINKLTSNSEVYYRILYTVWSIDGLSVTLPPLSKNWSIKNNEWFDNRK
ncbi:MAG: hypothetical protein JKY22_11650 [Flavobacteriaceae bacterium]|nr:hypothetical protein [Flavobacteriaceae bacterium]